MCPVTLATTTYLGTRDSVCAVNSYHSVAAVKYSVKGSATLNLNFGVSLGTDTIAGPQSDFCPSYFQ